VNPRERPPDLASPSTPAARAPAGGEPVEVRFTPIDNPRLNNLCGALDENLKQIEAALDVSIARRGERFSLRGRPQQTRLAAQALESFYEQAGQSLSVEDVQLGLIEVARSRDSRIEADDVPVLLTRRPGLHGRTPRQNQYIRQIQEHGLTFAIGPAGTGKTYLAVACAVDALERDLVKRIVLVRPAVEAGERLGFLPGDLAQKVDPYLRPMYDALYDLMGFDKTAKLLERGTIEIAPLAYMRGRTLNHSFVILDEAQNTTPEQMKMFLTRIGFGAKAVVTGDITQIDLAKGQKSGLVEAPKVLEKVRGIAFTFFLAEDVVRHPLVQRIVNAYEEHERGR
jgi:phosphate starvation-inducible PhoH-like protein